MNLRVVLVCPYSLDVPGGVGNHVLGLAGWLARAGHAPTVVAPGSTAPEVPGGVAVELLGPTLGLAFNGSVANLAVRPWQARRAVGACADADVVHVHEPLTPGAAFAAARVAGPLVVTHHASFGVSPPVAAALRIRASRLGRREVIAVSEAAARTARSVTGSVPEIIPNGIDLPPAPPPRNGPRGGSRPRVGFLGRIDEPRKGFEVFRGLADRAASEGIDAEFVAAGPGAAQPGDVRMAGALTNSQRAEFLGSIDVLVAPNLGGESFGLVLIEALAAGCDVVASDLPAFRRVLSEAGVGAQFSTGEPRDAARVLRARLGSPIDPLAAHRAASRWSWEEVGPRVLRVYGAVARWPRLGQ
ncbi:glycosyltransferase family 4 protein [Tessaracoccus sp. OS52]|uniref:glycosyltransferase family 4 protein n=1 Tax=Tessaracoccus sp. OS52 TaxID=2886691 RepID=UPI001D124DE7|nr:glycosyltransferase family 4 protein [Tessaracoccus sp. OS52]MCC2592858.1 glycosyltransferase family 4 protein [Tessaracoccus sp. OS52]